MSIAYQEYRERVNFKGNTIKKYVDKKVEESIDGLLDSQYGFNIKKYGEEEIHRVALLSTSSTQDYEKANIIAHNEVGLDRGVIFTWIHDNGEPEDNWIILQKMFRPEQPGFNGNAYRCNWILKWIDEEGFYHETPAYISSGRTTNSLTYTPDVNYKSKNIFLHDTDWSMIIAIPQDLKLHNEMRFIVKGQAYRVTNIDNVSIDNVSIMSLVDDKLLDDDDLVNNVADYNSRHFGFQKLLKGYMDEEHPENNYDLQMYVGDIRSGDGIVMPIKKGEEYTDIEYIITSLDPSIVEINESNLIGRGIGKATIRFSYKNNPLIYTDIIVETIETHPQTSDSELYIEGPDEIYWNTTNRFSLNNLFRVNYEIQWLTKVRHEVIFNDNSIDISIKDKYAGNIIITAQFDGKIYTKNVLIKTTD